MAVPLMYFDEMEGFDCFLIQNHRSEHSFDRFWSRNTDLNTALIVVWSKNTDMNTILEILCVFWCILMKSIDFDQKSKGVPFVLWSRVPLKSILSRYFTKFSDFHKTSDMNTILEILCFLMYFDEMEAFDYFLIRNDHFLIRNRRSEHDAQAG